MKATSRVLLALGLFLALTALPSAAQQKQAQDADLLRAKIEQFEKTDISSKSSSVQAIYQRTLLRLYNEFNSALLQDISELRAMQDVVSGTDTGSRNDIALQLQKLTREQGELAEKIKTLSGDLQVASAPPAPVANRTSQPTAVPVNFAPGRGAASAGELVASARSAADQPSRARVVAAPAVTDSLPTAQDDQPAATPEPPTLEPESIVEGSTRVVGTADKGASVEVFVNDTSVGTIDADGATGQFIKRLTGELKAGDSVKARQKPAGATDFLLFSKQLTVPEEKIDPYRGGAVGYLLGGAVFSQQGDQFNQADPFFGFIAGYSSFLRGRRRVPTDKWGNPRDVNDTRARICRQEDIDQGYVCELGFSYLVVRNAPELN